MGVTIKKPVKIIDVKSLPFGPKADSRDIIIGFDDYGNTYRLGYWEKDIVNETTQLSWCKIEIIDK